MTIRKFVLASALVSLIVAGSAAAQVSGSVGVTTSPVTTSVSPGTAVSLGTVTLTGQNGGGTVTSLPITISPSGGGAVGNLSNCQLYNASGTSLTTGSNVVNTVNGTTSNTFTLNNALTLSGTGATSVLTVRCNVANGTASGAVFTIFTGTPILGSALWVNLDTAPSVPAGSQDVTLANISLGATAATYNVLSIPLTVTAGNGGSIANLSGCVVRNTTNLDGVLSGFPTVTNGAVTNFVFSVPLTVFSGTHPMLALTCDLQPATAVGSNYTIAINPSAVSATNAATGAAVTPNAVVGIGPNGLPASTSGTVIVSALGTNPVPPVPSDPTPGVPNTGAGGAMAAILLLMGIAGIVALSGSMYLRRA